MEGLHPTDLIIHIASIIVLFILLRLILWNPMRRYLAARAARVQTELSQAEATVREAEELKTRYEQELGDIEAQGRALVRDSQLKALQEAQGIIGDARTQAQTLLDEARVKIDGEKARAVEAARHEMAQLASDMAARILKREVTADDNLSAVDAFFSEERSDG